MSVAVRLVGCLAVALTAARWCAPAVAAPSTDRKYQVRFFRPFNAGDRFHVDATIKLTTTHVITTLNGQPQTQSSVVEATCRGTHKILAIRKNGSASMAEFKVDELKCKLPDGPEASIEPGRVITTTVQGDRPVFRLDRGGRLNATVQRVLGHVMRLPSANRVPNDEIYGSTRPHGVGERWSINTTRLADDFAVIRLIARPQDAKGAVRIDSVRYVDGVPCLQLDIQFDVVDIIPMDLPSDRPDLLVECHCRATSCEPVDVTARSLDQKATFDWKYIYSRKGPDGLIMKIETTERSELDERVKILEPER